MKRSKKFKLVNLKIIFCLLCGTALGVSTNGITIAQTVENQTKVNENFELNIVQERITETNFTRSTDVRLSNENESGVKLEVGVGVQAEQINILLRGIFGRVNFRASLESIRQRIEQRRQTVLPK